ncbi:hypothetical protein JKP88DRAFT_204238 [Tribonema minus]|uniref:Uncharacterized protein n=1 Tax=Tribonema minus TaxID=303371 RepID=A0A835ZHV4_9STRA|nr:hypothetical protein JKP88DRAFT_204238 [Tribonema minus]
MAGLSVRLPGVYVLCCVLQLSSSFWTPPLTPSVACTKAGVRSACEARLAASNKTLEEEFDELDDMVMDRPANKGRDQVKIWGAWLDADIAGRNVGSPNKAAALKAKAAAGEALTDREKGEVFYEEAIIYMGKGEYDTAQELLRRAVAFVGEDSRRGGEFKLWLAQALQGVLDNDGAVTLLRSMRTHPDRDVRTVAKELLYIATAPKLDLEAADLVTFGAGLTAGIDDAFDASRYRELKRGPKVPYKDGQLLEKKPAYVVREYQPPPEANPAFLAVAVAVILGVSALVLHPGGQ